MEFVKRTLEGGLRVIVAPMESTETVTLLVLVGTGSNYEARKINGLSHFLEHMFFKGTRNHPKPGELDRMLDAVGAVHNAFTSREETGYWVKVDAKRFDFALTFVSDILQNALLKEEEINRERGVIIEEMKMYWDNPQRYIWSVFEELIYGDNSYGWDVIGTPDNIRKMKRDAFMQYWKSQYVAANTVVVVAGNVSAEGTIKKIESAFSNLRDGKPSEQAKLKSITPGPRVHMLEKQTDQSHILIGSLGYPLTHKDRLVAEVLATILGGYMSSRLFADIRGKHGLAYAINAGHQAYHYTGYFAAYAGSPHEKRQEVASRIVSHFTKIRKSGITSEELSRAKDNIKGHMALSLEGTDEVASFLGGQEVLLGRVEKPADILKKIEKITKNDIMRAARGLFRPDKMFCAVVGPRLDGAPYEKILSAV